MTIQLYRKIKVKKTTVCIWKIVFEKPFLYNKRKIDDNKIEKCEVKSVI